jgi:hypothetical protein
MADRSSGSGAIQTDKRLVEKREDALRLRVVVRGEPEVLHHGCGRGSRGGGAKPRGNGRIVTPFPLLHPNISHLFVTYNV